MSKLEMDAMKEQLKEALSETSSCSKSINSRFMQPLNHDLLTNFSIPLAFLTKLELELKGHSPESVVLMTEDQPQSHWVVRVEGGRHFKDGWEQFCVHHQLQAGDILVFRHAGYLLFLVTVFDPITACQRHFSTKILKSQGNLCSHVTAKIPIEKAQIPSCHVQLSSYSIKRALTYLPKNFIRSSGLTRKTCFMRVYNEEGLSWQVKLTYRKTDNASYLIGQQWKDFLTANKLKPKQVLIFHLVETGISPILTCSIGSRAK